jgi:hypothetical protein
MSARLTALMGLRATRWASRESGQEGKKENLGGGLFPGSPAVRPEEHSPAEGTRAILLARTPLGELNSPAARAGQMTRQQNSRHRTSSGQPKENAYDGDEPFRPASVGIPEPMASRPRGSHRRAQPAGKSPCRRWRTTRVSQALWAAVSRQGFGPPPGRGRLLARCRRLASLVAHLLSSLGRATVASRNEKRPPVMPGGRHNKWNHKVFRTCLNLRALPRVPRRKWHAHLPATNSLSISSSLSDSLPSAVSMTRAVLFGVTHKTWLPSWKTSFIWPCRSRRRK